MYCPSRDSFKVGDIAYFNGLAGPITVEIVGVNRGMIDDCMRNIYTIRSSDSVLDYVTSDSLRSIKEMIMR